MFYSDELEPEAILAQLTGCSCISSCINENSCICLLRSNTVGPNYSHNKCISQPLEENPSIIYECNSACACLKSNCCYNRLVQNALTLSDPPDGLIEVDSGHKGRGVKASRALYKGQFVCVYPGEFITSNRAQALAEEQQKRANGHVYILCLREFDGYEKRLVCETCIDGAFNSDESPKTAARINHSCSPNLCVLPVRVDSPYLPLLAFFALRPIAAGEELSYDYGAGHSSTSFTSANKSCYCGEVVCRGFLPAHQ